jgi:hypothetical protein
MGVSSYVLQESFRIFLTLVHNPRFQNERESNSGSQQFQEIFEERFCDGWIWEETHMKSCSHAVILFVFLLLSLSPSFSNAAAADPQGIIFPEHGSLGEPLRGSAQGSEILRSSESHDPLTVGILALGVNPWLDLLDKTSYSLKLSLPITWRPGFYGYHEEGGNSLSAGLLASVQLKAVPPRYGSWILSTGVFLIKEPGSLDQSLFGEFEYAGRVGTVNIRIVY